MVGAGPAGLALAAACARAGLGVRVLAPAPEAPWAASYGAWEDELPGELGRVWAHRWDDVVVELGDGPRRLGRPYVRLDNERLRARLRADAEGVAFDAGRAMAVEHEREGSRVATREGPALAARVVVDASGHAPVLLRRPRDRPAAYQTAYGVEGRFAHPPGPPGAMVLMDYRGGEGEDPTFLYAMDLGGGRWFAEETSLARRPPLPAPVLQERLRDRLGAEPAHVEAVERVAFPMGTRLPPRRQRVVGFGSAAGMVHPASGYQVAAALRRAPVVAAALAEALPRGPEAAARAAWHAVWPADLVAQRALHRTGLETLLRFDAERTRAFFRAFFDLPTQQWSGYLSGAGSAPALAATMLRLFATAPAPLRAALVRGVLTR